MENALANGIKTAVECISEMKTRGCDFSLLFWLRNPEILAESDIGKELTAFLSDIRISIDLFANPQFRDGFFQALREEFVRNGINKISPDNFVMDSGSGGKERALQKARQSQWPRPHQTFCFQTRGTINSAFFIYQCWQDGIRKILKLLESQVCVMPIGKDIHVGQIYEHCWGDARLSRLLIDWEIETPWLGGRRSKEEVQKNAEAFPAWFTEQLMRAGVLDPADRVRCTVKDKSRPIEGGHKVSFHFIFNIAGCPRGSHRVACLKVFDRFLTKLKEAATAKSFGSFKDKELDQPWIGADWRTMSGGHGFSVPFSRKKEGDPYPCVPYFLVLAKSRGSPGWESERRNFSWKDAEHSIPALGVDKCLRIFYQASYTPAAGDCVSYLHLQTLPTVPSQVGGTATRRHTPSVHRPGAPNFLPAWIVSDLNTRGGFTLNLGMPCLQVGSYVHSSLHDHLKGDTEEGKKTKKVLAMARVSNFPCPANLDKRPSVVHIHPSNGVFVAVDGDTVYCSCTECHFQSDRALKGGNLSLLKGTERQRYAWAILTQEIYSSLVHSIPVTGNGKRRLEITPPTSPTPEAKTPRTSSPDASGV